MSSSSPSAPGDGIDGQRSGTVGGLPSVSVPKGGGAIRGIGEKFTANPVTGTGSLSVPIPTSPGRSGFGPSLSLSYDSGNGNGPFGFGWSLSTPAITRKTDKALPRYADADESDVFVLSGAEDLVPLLDAAGERQEDDTSVADYVIHRYRPRVEGLFARIERWTRKSNGDVHWRSITRDNVLSVYGKDATARVADPRDPRRIFSWLLCETRDDKGNAVVYEYRAEDGLGVDLTQASERNRGGRNDARRAANRYLTRIVYGNRTPLLDDGGKRPAFLSAGDVENAGWMFEVVLDYDEGRFEEIAPDPHVPAVEQHRLCAASPTPAHSWSVRPDPFAWHRGCFEVVTYRRCHNILVFHHLPTLATGERGYEGLVRATVFDYADLDYSQPVALEDELEHQGSTRFGSFLRAVTQSGYVRDDTRPPVVHGGVEHPVYLEESLPPLEFEYSKARIQDDVLELDTASLENLPVGLDGSTYRWIDLDGEGVSGVLTEQGGGWFYKPNLGDGRLGPVETIRDKPSLSDLRSVSQHLVDLAGDGQLDLVSLDREAPGFFERRADERWESFRTFRSVPNLDWEDPNLRLVELAGGGHTDVLIAEQDRFTWYPSLAEDGFASASMVVQPLDEESGPRLVFADGTQSVYLADMCGDGLTDIVRIRNGEVCYWPNLGYGRFGSKVTMDHAPRFDGADQFDQRRVRLADIDGSGTTDLVYVGRERVSLYFNQCGTRLSEARLLPQLPHFDDHTSVMTVDLLGNGTSCLVWSSPLPADQGRPLRFVDLTGGIKPHLLTRCVNNLGAETDIHYAPSTRFYLDDKRAGRPWLTRLPFPVHVVERIVVTDRIGGNVFSTRHAYHHGFFDGVEREFRGFGLVEQWDTETFADSDVPPIFTKTWFHTGVYDQADEVSLHFAAEYYGAPRPDDPNYDDALAAFVETLLPDTVLPSLVTAAEEREACRALKGSMLRQEVYALDGSAKQDDPYTVTEQNFTVEALQARWANRHAVFYAHARESLAYHYERDPADPRVAHTLTLEVDAYGNVLQSAAIGYGRRQPDAALAAADQAKQAELLATYTENAVTKDHDTGADAVDTAVDYRTPVPCESRAYELTGVALPAGRERFSLEEIRNAAAAASTLEYEQLPTAGESEKRLVEHVRTYFRADDFSGALPLGRLQALAVPFESYRLAYTSGLVAQVFGARATSAMLVDEGRYAHTEADANWWIPSGRTFYSPNPGDSAAQELDYARQHFFLGHRHRDPFHTNAVSTESFVTYDGYDLLLHETVDPRTNKVTAGERRRILADGTVLPATRRNDYRVLQPDLVMDPNRNCTEVRFDALGLVVGTAVLGKPEDDPRPGDSLATFSVELTQAQIDALLNAPRGPAAETLLDDATTRIVYDVTRYWREPNPALKQPAVAVTLARETHASEAPVGGPRIQVTLGYSDAFGREIQTKVQAEPGRGPRRDANGDIILGPDGHPLETPNDVSPRWVGNGWTIFNNKGKPVRQYEPFFTDRHAFEADAAIGVSPVLFYDPPGRLVATLHPDHTWEKVVAGAWRQETWDANDTVMLDPAADPDVAGFFGGLPDADYLPTWDGLRKDPANAAAFAARFPDAADRASEAGAADKARVHAGTPTVVHADSLGRTVLTVAHNAFKYTNTNPADPRVEEFHRMRIDLDIEGNQRRVRDALTRTVDAADNQTVDELGRVIMLYDYDVAGTRVHESSMEGGERWALNDVAGHPLYAWDSLDRRFRTVYDALRRPTESFLQDGAAVEKTIVQTLYGESRADPEGENCRGRIVEIHDQAGVVTSEPYDFKGNLLGRTRRLAQSYKTTLDWSAAVGVEPDTYSSRTRYDALNRPIQIVPPYSDAAASPISVIQPGYNDANLLERVDVWLGLNAEPDAALDPGTASLAAVTNIDYDAKGRRTRLDREAPGGRVVRTSYTYDRETLRLRRLYTRRGVDPATGQGVAFTDDCENPAPPPPRIAAPEVPPQGADCGLQNLRYTYDATGNVTMLRDDAQQTIFFRNKRVEPSMEYTYDAVYRLIEATGREHLGQVGGAPVPHSYNDAPRIALAPPGDGNVMGTYLERYLYDAAGNFLSLEHHGRDPAHPGWTRDYAYHEPSTLEPAKQGNRLTSTSIGGVTEVYSAAGDGYDAHGRMLRLPHLSDMQWSFKDQLRMTRRQVVDAADADGQAHDGERTWYVYDASGERIRKVTEADGQVKDERMYLGGVERYRRNGANPLVREMLHIVDDQQHLALVETRIEGVEPGVPEQLVRHQFGNHIGSALLELDDQALVVSYEEYTPYGSTSYQAVRGQVEAKRYRYTGRERDEESGFYHHGARYYAPWLGRWTSADPAGIEPDGNRYRYCRSTPVMLNDPGGTDPPDDQHRPFRVTPLLTDVSPTGVTGDLQFHDLFSSDRSVSGRVGLSGNVRSSFLFSAPGLQLNTSGLADLSATAAVDTNLGRGGLALRGGLILGELSDLHLVTTGAGTFRIPVPDRIALGGLPGSLLTAIPQGEGDVHLTGALLSGHFSLATFEASGTLAEGRFQGRLDARSIANVGRLHLDASGTVSPTGDVSLESARLNASVGVPGVRLDVQGTGTATAQGNLALRANADLHLLGLPSLHAEGTGTASTSGADFAGRFYGPGPLYTSYITGDFSLSTRTGISGSASVFGLTYTPGVTLSNPPPTPPLGAGGPPAAPWTPQGLTLGASYFQYQHGVFTYISGGFMPDLSARILTNPRFGVSAEFHF